MDYTDSRPHHGSPAKILEQIRAQLTNEGFRLDGQDQHGLAMTGPGMHSSRQNALLGMTRVEVRVSRRDIAFEADLGGVRFLQWFVTLFPLVLGIVMFALFVHILPVEGVVWAPLAAVAPWIVLGPLMGRWLKQRTLKAIDTLLHNAISIAESEQA